MGSVTVTLKVVASGHCETQQLVEGRLDWPTVEKAFNARVVRIEGSGSPPLYHQGGLAGLTRCTFEAGAEIPVCVERAGDLCRL